MNCPVCQTALLMTDRQGIEIDYCPTCRGVWLDRGELDKIIERASMPTQMEAPYPPPPAQTGYRGKDQRDDSYRHDDSYADHDQQRRHKKKSFWSEMFDFD